jgi:putative membrane protein
MMRNAVIRWFINAVALGIAAMLINGIVFNRLEDLLIASALFGLLNISIRPLLLIITLPINLLTLGLFTFVINAAMLGLTAWLLAGFVVFGFWPALGGALIISLVSLILNSIFQENHTR